MEKIVLYRVLVLTPCIHFGFIALTLFCMLVALANSILRVYLDRQLKEPPELYLVDKNFSRSPRSGHYLIRKLVRVCADVSRASPAPTASHDIFQYLMLFYIEWIVVF